MVDGSGAAIGGARVEVLYQDAARWRVRISAPGFQPAEAEGAAADVAPVRVVLAVAAVNEAITVMADPPEQAAFDAAEPQTAVTRDIINLRNNRRAGDIIQRLPGVYMSGPPGANQDVRMRGLDKEYSRTQVDGLQLPDGGEKREMRLSRLPSAMIESVSIIRNPTAEYESDGFAGRVEVKSRPAPAQTYLETRGGYGWRGVRENGIGNGSAAFGARPREWFGFFANFDQLSQTTAIGRGRQFTLKPDEAESESHEVRSPNFSGDAAFFTRAGEFHVKPLLLQQTERKRKDRLVEGASRDIEAESASMATRGFSASHRSGRLGGLVWDTTGAFHRMREEKDKTRDAFKLQSGQFLFDKASPETEAKLEDVWQLQSSGSLPFRARFAHDLKTGVLFRGRDRFRDKTRLEIAKNGAVQDITQPQDVYSLGENYAAFFIQDRIRLRENLSFTPGVRAEHVRLHTLASSGEGAQARFLDVNPSAHLTWTLKRKFNLRAAASRGLARPKFDDLAPYERETSKEIITGNPGLQPARAWSFDAGGEYLGRRLFLGANFFHKRIRGVIEQVNTGALREGRTVLQVMNVGDGWTRGVELEQRFDLPGVRGLRLWLNQTALASALTDFNRNVRPFKDQPRLILNGGFDYYREGSGTGMSMSFNRVGARDELKLDGTWKSKRPDGTLDLAFQQRLRGNLSFYVEADNLTNARRLEREAFADGGFSFRDERYGRGVVAGLSWRLR